MQTSANLADVIQNFIKEVMEGYNLPMDPISVTSASWEKYPSNKLAKIEFNQEVASSKLNIKFAYVPAWAIVHREITQKCEVLDEHSTNGSHSLIVARK